MPKIESREVLRRVKSKGKPERANVTFRMPIELMEEFKKACSKQGVTPTAVLEELILSFLQDL